MRVRLRHILWLMLLAALLLLMWSRTVGRDALVPPPASVIELQPLRTSSSLGWPAAPQVEAHATLTDLNPRVGAWYLLQLSIGGAAPESYHLEGDPAGSDPWRLLTEGQSLYVQAGSLRCELWSARGSPLADARRTGLPYAPLCGERLYLRNPVKGTRTVLEHVTQFLRDRVWGGDEIVNLVKDTAFRDAFIERGAARGATAHPPPSTLRPADALIDAAIADPGVVPDHLGITVSDPPASFMLGCWYPIQDQPGTWLSIMRPGAVAARLLASERARVNPLDPIESNGLDYLVAFDVTMFRFRFSLGTDHPRVDWSDRVLPDQLVQGWPGPDGIGNSEPLARTGMVNPSETTAVIATFAGGFKREHGAFRYGALATRNHGSHYGFMEQGVIFSRLQPGLATFFTTLDGAVRLKTWTPEDARQSDTLVDARQNGVALIEYDAASHSSHAGDLVNQWGAGNWSGSSDRQLRTVRAGLCLQHGAARDFLLFGFFSAATPSAMTRVFEAYGCRYAMQLDINALEHTYFAMYVRRPGRMEVQHLVQGMEEVDRKGGSRLAPRFLGFPDDRDFFYVTRRASP